MMLPISLFSNLGPQELNEAVDAAVLVHHDTKISAGMTVPATHQSSCRRLNQHFCSDLFPARWSPHVDSVPLHDPSLEPVGKVRIQVARQPRKPRALDVRSEDTGAQSNGTQKQGERDTGLGPRQPTAALARQGTHLELSDHVDVEEDQTEHL